MMKRYTIILMIIVLAMSFAFAGNGYPKGSLEWFKNGPEKNWTASDYDLYYTWQDRLLSKASEDDPQILRRQKTIMNGNKITTEIWNYGSISRPGNRVTDIVWEGLGYGYEFGPFICAEVVVDSGSHIDAFIAMDTTWINDSTYTTTPILDDNGKEIWKARVISDGLTSNGGEVSSDGSDYWGWSPLAYNDDLTIPYADPNTDKLPTSNDIDRDGDGKPDSWPAGWYNENLKRYVWPGALKQDEANSDMEVFFVVDDRGNKEFEYYPFENDSSKKGLGLEIESRYYQWSNPLAEDIIFLVYKATNKSDKDLNDVIFGMWGDPHIGGPSNWQDDLSYFDKDLNMVYAWDEDGISDKTGYVPGYFGYKFLESPGNPYDGIDNDGDGMIDESWYDGIDNDGDWDPDKHDVGIDGVPNTGDFGEGDGIPNAGDPYDPRQPGEPNFEFTDLDESDMIGLTSFAAPAFGGLNRISNDDYIIRNYMQPGYFDSTGADVAGDNIFLYGSGKFTLKAGESRRFSIALLVGEDFDDLTLNAITAEEIFQRNYQFAKPPQKPLVTAIPGDEKVTLYWDDLAESSYDPVSESYDFEGYVIYRSTDPLFLDQQTITDANGSNFLFEPLKTVKGASARFDLDNEYKGLSEVPYSNRGVSYNLGNNTGLTHMFVDSNNVINGQTYYYAVVSYDHGDVALEISPTECSKNITLNPETNEVFLDINTAKVTPRAPAAGYSAAEILDGAIEHTAGSATGDITLEVIDADIVEDANEFEITFEADPIRYFVEDKKVIEYELFLTEDYWYQLPYKNLNDTTFVLYSAEDNTQYYENIDYEFSAVDGQVRRLVDGNIASGQDLVAQFTYFPVWGSENLDMEEGNPVFDGLKIFAKDNTLELNTEDTGWMSGSVTDWTDYTLEPFYSKRPGDFEIRFYNEVRDTSELRGIAASFEVYDVTSGQMPVKVGFEVLEAAATRDGLWQVEETIVVFERKPDNSFHGWKLTLNNDDSLFVNPPQEGDVFYISTTRPFTDADVYSFKTVASHIDSVKASNSLDDIYVAPNPYVAVSVFEPYNYQELLERGDRLIYFANLPQDCTIRIYTVSGELVNTLEHHGAMANGQKFWNMTTKDNFPIAFGVYIYHVDAGELGEKIGRFAVIK